MQESASTCSFNGDYHGKPGPTKSQKVVTNELGRARLRYLKVQVRPVYSNMSASTAPPTGPYSSTDIIGSYNNDSSRLIDTDLKPNGSLDSTIEKRRGPDLRPSSRKESRRSLVANNTRERANTLEKEGKDVQEKTKEHHGIPHKQNYFKPTGVRNNFLTGHQAIAQKMQPPTPTGRDRESDNLVAMGTLFSPDNTPGGGRSQNPPLARNGRQYPTQSNHVFPGSHIGSTNHGSAPQPVTTMPFKRTMLPRANSNPHSVSQPGITRSIRETEPKYHDPACGAPPSFAQRIAELGALESDTVRWERARKLKKKIKGDG